MEALYAMNPIKVGLDDMLYRITHWAAHILILANTRPHQLCWVTRRWGLLSHAESAVRWRGSTNLH